MSSQAIEQARAEYLAAKHAADTHAGNQEYISQVMDALDGVKGSRRQGQYCFARPEMPADVAAIRQAEKDALAHLVRLTNEQEQGVTA